MEKIIWASVISGFFAGLIGSVLVSFDWSLFSVAVVGAIIGAIISYGYIKLNKN